MRNFKKHFKINYIYTLMELDVINYEIDSEAQREIEKAVEKFFTKAEPDVVLIFDKAGRILAYKGKNISDTYSEFISSILSALFFASEELTSILDKSDEMKDVFYETKNRVFLMAKLEKDFLVGVISRKNLSLGSIRLFFNYLVSDLNSALKNLKEVEKRSLKISKEELKKKLDEILGS